MTVATRAQDAAKRAKKLSAIREQKLAAADARFRKAWGDRRPTFGDPEQIKLLHQWQADIGGATREHDEAASAVRLREYRVSYSDVTVYALTADEAEDMAREHEPSVEMVTDEGEAEPDAEEGVLEW